MEEGIDYDFEKDLSDEAVLYILDMIADFPDESKDDILIDVLLEALAGALMGFKLMNPQFTQKQILDQALFKLRSKFHNKAGLQDFDAQDLLCIN